MSIRPRAAAASVLGALLGALAACGPGVRGDIAQPRGPDSTAAERAYRPPPFVEGATLISAGRVLLVGRADPRARVRLATPGGEALTALTAANGVWRMVLPPSPQVRLFGLSMLEAGSTTPAGRAVQAEGYLAVTPRGEAAQLRAGSGARVLGAGAAPRILAVDFDRKGGAVVSGRGPPGATLTLSVDGSGKGRIAVDRAGRFALALDEPLSAGDHKLALSGAALNAPASIAVWPAEPLARGPFRTAFTAAGWRIDWTTPGGGVQTTLIIATARSGEP